MSYMVKDDTAIVAVPVAAESEELDPDVVTLAARAFHSWLHSVLLSSV